MGIFGFLGRIDQQTWGKERYVGDDPLELAKMAAAELLP